MRLLATFLAVFGASTVVAAPPEKIDPQKLLYTTPTINDAIPIELVANSTAQSGIVTHEDNWRQFEFISSRYKKQIESELSSIDGIWKNESVKTGDYTAFRKVHVRKLIPAPLALPFSVTDFSTLFGQKPSSFAFLGSSQALRNVYAIRCGGFSFYAEIVDGKLLTLGIDPNDKPSFSHDAIFRLETFIRKNELVLVHWPSRTMLESPDAIMGYLNGKHDG